MHTSWCNHVPTVTFFLSFSLSGSHIYFLIHEHLLVVCWPSNKPKPSEEGKRFENSSIDSFFYDVAKHWVMFQPKAII